VSAIAGDGRLRHDDGDQLPPLVWAVLDRASRGWRGLTMTSDGLRLLQDLRRPLLQPPRQLRPPTVTAAHPRGARQLCR
jgi:hypothetical protein